MGVSDSYLSKLRFHPMSVYPVIGIPFPFFGRSLFMTATKWRVRRRRRRHRSDEIIAINTICLINSVEVEKPRARPNARCPRTAPCRRSTSCRAAMQPAKPWAALKRAVSASVTSTARRSKSAGTTRQHRAACERKWERSNPPQKTPLRTSKWVGLPRLRPPIRTQAAIHSTIWATLTRG